MNEEMHEQKAVQKLHRVNEEDGGAIHKLKIHIYI